MPRCQTGRGTSMVKRAGGALLLGIAIEHGAARPVSTQLYAGLRDLMLSGSLAAGERLPATRTARSRPWGFAHDRHRCLRAPDRRRSDRIRGWAPEHSSAQRSRRTGRVARPSAAGLHDSTAPVLSRTMASRGRALRRRVSGFRTHPRAFITALPASTHFRWAMGPHCRQALAPRHAAR